MCTFFKYKLTKYAADEVAEWLRRWTANPLGSARVGSNPIFVGNFLCLGVSTEMSIKKKLPSIILLAAICARHICYCTIHFRSINKRSRRGMTHFKHQFQFWNFWNFNGYKSLPKQYELGSCCVGHTAVLSMP